MRFSITTIKSNGFYKGIREKDEKDMKKEKVGRNQICPCGSGIKYKKCCAAGKRDQNIFKHPLLVFLLLVLCLMSYSFAALLSGDGSGDGHSQVSRSELKSDAELIGDNDNSDANKNSLSSDTDRLLTADHTDRVETVNTDSDNSKTVRTPVTKTISYTYDNNGNMLTRSDSSQPAETLRFEYNSRNQLVQSSKGPPGSQTLLGQYDYNAGGMRVRHRHSDRGDVDYFYDGNSVIEERNTDGSLLAHYRYADRLFRIDTSGDTQYYHHDALGSTVNLTDSAGNAEVSYKLDPWGHILSQTGTTFNRHIFTGQEHDENTGLINFGVRLYEPDIVRFITQDAYLGELGIPSSHNRYNYARSNPTVYVDLTGYFSVHTNRLLKGGAPGPRITMNWLKQQEWRDSVLAEGGTVLEQDDNYPEILRPFYFRNRKQQFAETWENAPTDKKIVIAATGAGTASQVIPYAGDYGSLLSSVVVVAAEPSWDAAGDILLDAAGAVLPFFPAFGTIRRMERIEDIGHAVEGTVDAADTAKDIVKYKNGITVEDPTGRAAFKIYDAPNTTPSPALENSPYHPNTVAGRQKDWQKLYTQNSVKLRPEGKYLKGKKHGVKWTEGPATAKNLNKPQGQWNKTDLDFAGQKASSLKPGQGDWFDLPKGSKSVVHLPDGRTVPAKRIWVRNNGTGTFHGYPAE